MAEAYYNATQRRQNRPTRRWSQSAIERPLLIPPLCENYILTLDIINVWRYYSS